MTGFRNLTQEDLAILHDYDLRAQQLRNIQVVMNGSITPKKLKRLETEVLPGYIQRERNAKVKAQKVIEKKYDPTARV